MKKAICSLLLIALMISMSSCEKSDTPSDLPTGGETSDTAAATSDVSDDSTNGFVKGTPGTFYAYVWHKTSRMDNLYRPFSFTSVGTGSVDCGNIEQNGIEMVAKQMKNYFDKIPDGKRAINPTHTLLYLYEEQENLYWYDKGLEKHNRIMGELFEKYLELGGKPIDEVTCDMEGYCNVWYADGFANKHNMTRDEVYYAVQNDPRYPELKAELSKYDFTFYEGDDHPELYYMYANARNTYPNQEPIKDVYVGINFSDDWVDRRYLDKVYELYESYFPGIKFSQYDSYEKDVPKYSTTGGGHNYGYFDEPTPVEEREHTYVGTHSSWANYGLFTYKLVDAPPPDYPYARFYSTPFNAVLYQVVAMQNALLYMPDSKIQPWVGCYSFCYQNATPYAVTDYYHELIYHFGLGNPDPFLFYNYEDGQYGLKDNEIFSELLCDLDELVGFEDRCSLLTERTSFDSRYILSGMYAGGKNVWRITPDLSTDDVTIESFKVSDSPLTFRIGQQVVEFPEGSYIYESDRPHEYAERSKAGYWVISPEGTEPREYLDESQAPTSEPTYLFGGEEELKARVAAFVPPTTDDE